MTWPVSDDFSYPDDASLDTRANWTEGTGTGTASSGQARFFNGRAYMYALSNFLAYYNDAPPSADYAVEADYHWLGSSGTNPYALIGARIAQPDGGYTGYFFAQFHTGATRIYKIINGSLTTLASSTDALTVGVSVSWRLEVEGTAIRVYKNGSSTPHLSATDGDITDAGYAGIGFRGGQSGATNESEGIHIDNFLAVELSSSGGGVKEIAVAVTQSVTLEAAADRTRSASSAVDASVSVTTQQLDRTRGASTSVAESEAIAAETFRSREVAASIAESQSIAASVDVSGAATSEVLRPSGNITQTGFTNGFAEIDEEAASDADFAYGENNTAAVLEVALTDPAGSFSSATATVRYRVAKTNSGVVDDAGNSVTITAALYQGTTLVATDGAQTCTGTWTTYEWAPDTSSVTDWTDLRLRFTTSSSGGSPANRRGGAVSWAEVAVAAVNEPKQISGSIAQVVSLAASVAASRTASAAVTQTQSVAGSLTRTRPVSTSVGEAASVSGAAGRIRALVSSVTESQAISSGIGRLVPLAATVTEAASVAVSALTKVKLMAASIAQAVTLSAAYARIRNVASAVSEAAAHLFEAKRSRGVAGTVASSQAMAGSARRDRTVSSAIEGALTLDAALGLVKALAAAVIQEEGITAASIARIRGMLASLDEAVTITASVADATALPETVTFTLSITEWQVVDGKLGRTVRTEQWTFTTRSDVALETTPSPGITLDIGS